MMRDFAHSKVVLEALKAVEELMVDVDSVGKGNLQRAYKETLGLSVFLDDSPVLKRAMEEWLALQKKFVDKIVTDFTDKLGTIISRAIQDGLLLPDIEEELKKLYNITDNRAKFLARNEVGQLNSIITKIRQTDAGIEAYEWNSSHDERVRPEHRKHDGKYFYWTKKTAGEIDGVKVYPALEYPPGADYNCRCVAIPVIDFEHINFKSVVPLDEFKPNETTSIG